jgi:hypothetical protein
MLNRWFSDSFFQSGSDVVARDFAKAASRLWCKHPITSTQAVPILHQSPYGN